MDRRTLLQSGLAAGTLVLAGQAKAQQALVRIRVDPPEVFRTTVCLRPFRAQGPRIEAEALGRKTVVHNYGHGGSGWSLSWGSAAEAVRLAMRNSPKKIAVIGAGALGLTAAITAQRVDAAALPFNAVQVRRGISMTFNVADYARQLEADFLAAGGRFEQAEFQSPADLLKLKEHVLINCTGYGARALWKDETITPVRGQIVWLAPQADVHYGAWYHGLSILARRDGIVVQELGPNDNFGFGDDNETPDPVAAQAALDKLKTLYKA